MTALPEVLEKLERATPGEWRWSVNGNIVPTPYSDTEIAAVYSEHDDDTIPANAAAIIAAVNFLREHGPALLASQQYAEANPLGGPASMLETAARRIRAGEDFHEVLADYDLHSGVAMLRDAGDAND